MTGIQRTERFHQARWNEPIIFELDSPGERGFTVPHACDEIARAVGDGCNRIPAQLRRNAPPALPELGQMQIVKHYLRLSQETLGADLNVDVGQGTCTIKYSPKINERFVRSHKLADVHPLQDPETVQGSLAILHETERFFCEISGMDRFTFQPRSGSQAILTMASMVRAYHDSHAEGCQRDEVITSLFSHPSDAAAAHVLGYKIVTLQQDPVTGLPDVEKLAMDQLAGTKGRKGEFGFLATIHMDQGHNNCAPTSAAMALNYYYKKAIDPYAIKQNSTGSGPPGTGTCWDHMMHGIKHVSGDQWEFRSYPRNDEGYEKGLKVLKAEIDARRVVLIDLGPHTVVMAGYDSGRKVVYIQNPAYRYPGVHTVSFDDLKRRWHSPWHVSTTRGRSARPLLLTASSAKKTGAEK